MGMTERSLLPTTSTRGGVVPSIEAMLRVVAGFEELPDPALEHIALSGKIIEAPQGEVLFREGAVAEALHVMLEGHVGLTGTAADSTSAVIDIAGPGTSFVLASVLTGEPYRMGSEVVVNARIIMIPAAPIRAAVTAQPAAAMAMMRAMAAELGAMTRQVVDLKVRIVAQRLGTYLLNLVGESTTVHAELRLPVNKGLLASWLGCRAENLSRAFMALRAYGVETHGSRVLLHDIPRLRAYAAALPDSDAVSQGIAAGRPPIETILGEAFRLRSSRPRES